MKWVKKLSFHYFYYRKDEACRLNGKNILHKAEEALKTRSGNIKNKHGDKESKNQTQDNKKRGVEIQRDIKAGRFM